MRCATARKWISRYIDGDLEARRRDLLEKHIAGCPECRKLLLDLQKIVNHAGEVSGPPAAGVTWGKIQNRLAAEEDRLRVPVLTLKPVRFLPRWTVPAAALGAALLLAAIGALVLQPGFFSRGPVVSHLERQTDTLNKLEEAELHYQQALKALAEAVEAQGQEIDPLMAEMFRSNLEIVNMSIAACKQAVLADPQDFESRRFLLAAYQQKAEILSTLMNVRNEGGLLSSVGNTL